jgi:hypothetical protein
MQAEETITHLRFLRIESAILKHNIIEHCETWIYKFTYAIFLLYLLKPTLSVYKLSYKCVKKYFFVFKFSIILFAINHQLVCIDDESFLLDISNGC